MTDIFAAIAANPAGFWFIGLLLFLGVVVLPLTDLINRRRREVERRRIIARRIATGMSTTNEIRAEYGHTR